MRRPLNVTLTHDSASGAGFAANREPIPGDKQTERGQAGQAPKPQPVRVGAKVGRNDPCPCGSGKKYKNCHGA